MLDILRRNYSVTRLDNKAGWKRFNETKAASVTNCLSAHMPYGLHHMFPETANPQYITFLRHPVDRLMSFYYYVKSRRGKSVWREALDGVSLNEFLYSNHLHDNEMVRYIAGVEDISLPKITTVTAEHVAEAKRNLEKFLFVGDMATYQKDLQRMGDVLQIDIGKIPHRLNTSNPGRNALTRSQRQQILSFVQKDLELYRYAKNLIRLQTQN